MVLVALGGTAALMATAALALTFAQAARARHLVYGVCLATSLVLLAICLIALLGMRANPSVTTLPLGIPWLEAHFRLYALSSLFLAVVNVCGAAAYPFVPSLVSS